jgi:5-methylcytosine-specific restriction endonuclease McrA
MTITDPRKRFYAEYRHWRHYYRLAERIISDSMSRGESSFPSHRVAASRLRISIRDVREAMNLFAAVMRHEKTPPQFAYKRVSNVTNAVAQRAALYSGCCWICGKQGAGSIDHVKPLSKGGARTLAANLRPAHFECNNAKSNIWPFPVRPNFGKPLPL